MNYSNHINYNNRHQLSDQRNALINNRGDYTTGNRIHQIVTVQIISREEWDNLGHVLGSTNPQIDYLFRVPLNYINNLLEDYENGIGSINGQLLISMIIEYSNDMFNAIFFIHNAPHHNFIDGEIFQVQFLEGNNIHRFIGEFFNNDFTLVENVTEYEMLRLVRDEGCAIQLLETFLEGFDSLIIENGPHRNFSFGDNIEIINNDLPIPNYIDNLEDSNYIYGIYNLPIPNYIDNLEDSNYINQIYYPNLPRQIPNYSWLAVDNEELECDCAICLYPHDTYVKTPCGHIFGKNCLLTWIETGKKNCPYCRSNFNE
jgi:hypothetical protein